MEEESGFMSSSSTAVTMASAITAKNEITAPAATVPLSLPIVANGRVGSQEKPFDMVYFLQKVIVDLNRSFDPNALKDDHLRGLLLAEIIECQRNLLSQAQKNRHEKKNATASRNFKKDKVAALNGGSSHHHHHNHPDNDSWNITQNRIYDEWKVLAMVVDRICFFLYMFLLLLMIALIYFFNWFT